MTSSTEGTMADEVGFSIVDYVIFALVLSVSMSIGLYYALTGGKQRTAGEFLMGNRKLSTFPVSLSILVSYISAIMVLGTPAEMYTHGTQLLMRTVGYCLACGVSSLLFVPLFYSLNLTSSFEYLERRYKSRFVRLCGTVMMLISNTFYMGLVMYTPSTALEAATGFPLMGSIVITGVVSMTYTAIGGMKAVVWTDAFQALIMMGGMLAIVIQGCVEVGGIQRVWTLSSQGNRIQFFNFDPDPRVRLTFWSTVVGGMFHTLIAFGVGQTSVQRYCSLPSLAKAKRSVFLNIPSLLLVNTLAGLVGLVVYAFYANLECDPLKSGAISNPNQLVPHFVTTVLNYPGLPGVFLAVLFCGALSSMSSSLNAASAVTWEDFLKDNLRLFTETRKTLLLKLLVILYGSVSVGLAFLANKLTGHVLWASISFTGATSGPSLGLFLLGSIFPWANKWGAICGFFLASGLNLWVAIGSYIYRPFRTSLPTSTEGCNHGNYSADSLEGIMNFTSHAAYNWTVEVETGSPETEPMYSTLGGLYNLSFLWYSALGCLVTVTIGLVVSFLTGAQDPEDLDPDLLIPVADRICCCLPEAWRQRLQCGVKHKKNKPDVLNLEDNTKSPEDEALYSSETPLTSYHGDSSQALPS